MNPFTRTVGRPRGALLMIGYTSKLARGDSHRLQRGYTYQLIEPIGRNFDDGFTSEVAGSSRQSLLHWAYDRRKI